MRYALVGFGSIGKALAKHFARNDIELCVATTRKPESVKSEAAEIGPRIIPKTLDDAVKADIVFLAVRFESYKDVAKALPSWDGKIIVDLTNAYGVEPERLGGLPSSKAVEAAFTGANLVKGFNHLPTSKLAQNPEISGGGKRVIFLSGDNKTAVETISQLTHQLGFAPIYLGSLSEGGLLVQGKGKTWGHLIFKDLFKFD